MNFSRMSIVVLLGALVLSPLCAGGDHERGGMSRHMEMKGFTQLEVSSGIRVEITQGNGFSVQARGDRSAIDRIEMRVQGNTLHIGFKPVWFGSGSVTVAVAMPALEAIDLSGGSQGLLDFDASKGRPVSLSVSGGSQLQGTLLASDIAIELSGGSQLTLGGYAMNGRVEARSSAHAGPTSPWTATCPTSSSDVRGSSSATTGAASSREMNVRASHSSAR